jgi:hypothetical protein
MSVIATGAHIPVPIDSHPKKTAAYMYTDREVTEVEADEAVPLNKNGYICGGISHNTGSPTIHIHERGLYRATFIVNTVGASTFALTVNDRLVPASLVHTSGGQKMIGQVILQLECEDCLKIRNCSGVRVELDTFAGGKERNVRASIILNRIE